MMMGATSALCCCGEGVDYTYCYEKWAECPDEVYLSFGPAIYQHQVLGENPGPEFFVTTSDLRNWCQIGPSGLGKSSITTMSLNRLKFRRREWPYLSEYYLVAGDEQTGTVQFNVSSLEQYAVVGAHSECPSVAIMPSSPYINSVMINDVFRPAPGLEILDIGTGFSPSVLKIRGNSLPGYATACRFELSLGLRITKNGGLATTYPHDIDGSFLAPYDQSYRSFYPLSGTHLGLGFTQIELGVVYPWMPIDSPAICPSGINWLTPESGSFSIPTWSYHPSYPANLFDIFNPSARNYDFTVIDNGVFGRFGQIYDANFRGTYLGQSPLLPRFEM